MFHARNRPVMVVKIAIQAYSGEEARFELEITLECCPEPEVVPEAAALIEGMTPGKKASLSLKKLGGLWAYEIDDGTNMVSLVGSPKSATVKVSGALLESLRWSVDVSGVEANSLLQLARWHGKVCDLCADRLPDKPTVEPAPAPADAPLLNYIERQRPDVPDDVSLDAPPPRSSDPAPQTPPQDEPRVFLKSRYIAQVRTSEGTYTVSIATPPDGVEPKPWVCSCDAYHEKDTCPHLALVQKALDDAKAREV